MVFDQKWLPLTNFPTMLIKAEALEYWLENFYGYGSRHAGFWFVGYEETGGDVPEEVAENLNYFYKLKASNTHTLSATSVNCTVMWNSGWTGHGPIDLLISTTTVW
jgi:hypothetical protein